MVFCGCTTIFTPTAPPTCSRYSSCLMFSVTFRAGKKKGYEYPTGMSHSIVVQSSKRRWICQRKRRVCDVFQTRPCGVQRMTSFSFENLLVDYQTCLLGSTQNYVKVMQFPTMRTVIRHHKHKLSIIIHTPQFFVCCIIHTPQFVVCKALKF